MKSKTHKDIPQFQTEDEEKLFWDSNDSTDYIDWNKAKTAKFANLKITAIAMKEARDGKNIEPTSIEQLKAEFENLKHVKN